jgi:hypothetical protein
MIRARRSTAGALVIEENAMTDRTILQIDDAITAFAKQFADARCNERAMSRSPWFHALVIGAALLAGFLIASSAQARRHHGGGCGPGLIHILHSGQCVTRLSAARQGIGVRARRYERRLTRHHRLHDVGEASPEPRAAPLPPQRDEAKCQPAAAWTAWMPDPVGWPAMWMRAEGLPQLDRWRMAKP